MSLLFKMQKPDIKVRILDIPNFRETQKDTWYHKSFEERGEVRKIKIHMWTVCLLTCSPALNMIKKIMCKCLNEMKCQVYTVLRLVLLVKMKNIIPNKIYLTVVIWKTWYYKKLLSNRKESKYGDYYLLFLMRADDNEQ